MSHNSI